MLRRIPFQIWIFSLLRGMDVVTTLIGINRSGLQSELNVVQRFFLSIGPNVFVLEQLVLTVAIMFVGWCMKWRAWAIMNALTLLVVLNNILGLLLK